MYWKRAAGKGEKTIESNKGRRKIDDVENGEAEDNVVSTKQKKMRKGNVNMGNKDTTAVKEAIGKFFAYWYGL